MHDVEQIILYEVGKIVAINPVMVVLYYNKRSSLSFLTLTMYLITLRPLWRPANYRVL